MTEPVLILQLQRLGDLVLTFPLVNDIHRTRPGTPVWMVAEQQFFKELQPLVPSVTFFPPASLAALAKENFSAVYNFSSRQDAAHFCGAAKTGNRYGFIATETGTRISGFWQLYRAALTSNNRHNSFHWADLNRLDNGVPLIPAPAIPDSAGKKQVGIFIGASEPAKRPSTLFWIDLVKSLMRRGIQPVLLGGPAEKEEGAIIAEQTRIAANFCGKTTITQLLAIMRSLALLITPDTGPMHLANLAGCRVLNLSLGNVNAHETGPAGPGQFILHADVSCYGCWSCTRKSLFCHRAFNPGAVAKICMSLIAGKLDETAIPDGLKLRKTFIEAGSGLITLSDLQIKKPDLQTLLSSFWRNSFLHFFDTHPWGLKDAAIALAEKFPKIAAHMHANFGRLLASLSLSIKRDRPLDDSFWQCQPVHSSLYAGFLHMSLQNKDYSQTAMRRAVDDIAALKEIFTPLS